MKKRLVYPPGTLIELLIDDYTFKKGRRAVVKEQAENALPGELVARFEGVNYDLFVWPYHFKVVTPLDLIRGSW